MAARPMERLLIANRGEIAIRVARTAAEMGLRTLGVYSQDDRDCLHVRSVDTALGLAGRGAGAYLDGEALVAKALESAVDAVHPGYGFLSEDARFAQQLEAAGVVFVGPTPETLTLFGDKVQARALAHRHGVPCVAGSEAAVTLEQARAFFANLDSGRAMILKAVAGGGGRGMRVVSDAAQLEAAYSRAASEAELAFGNAALYVEEVLPRARHIEVQILGDGRGAVSQLWERECSVQRRHQKLLEIAPSPTLRQALRREITSAALALGAAVDYRSLGTVEFLVDAEGERFFFMEVNARLQVEHTVTEEVLGIDLVRTQLEIARGSSLEALGLGREQVPVPRGYAIQARVNAETMARDGSTRPSAGVIGAFQAPTGPGIRTDSCAYAGYQPSPSFDSLLAKVIAHSPAPGYADAVRRLSRALSEMQIVGLPTNLGFLQKIVEHPRFARNEIHVGFLDEHMEELVPSTEAPPADEAPPEAPSLAGARLDSIDPLAVLDHARSQRAAPSGTPEPKAAPAREPLPDGVVSIDSPMQGTIVHLDVEIGSEISVGKTVLIMEAMKMEHEVRADVSGVVLRLGVSEADTVFEGHPLMYLEEREVARDAALETQARDLDHIRPDLQEVLDRHAAGHDENRPEAVAKRHSSGSRTARENIEDLCDPGSFIEYGSVVLAAQRRRRDLGDLIANTTGDGMVCGLGRVNGECFDERRSRAMLMSYDYMVLAGTQGGKNHEKKDRLFEIAERYRLPTVLFAEGGGGRPGDTDSLGVAGLDCMAFTYFARLSGLVPLVGITNGRCFAGNAVLLACCDVIIATEGSNIGIGGPAMIEGGGLGIFRPDEVGPMDVQVHNGVVDIPVADEAEAVQVAKRYLAYFQGAIDDWEAPDPRELRFVVPENRLRYYDMKRVIRGIADLGSVLEIRPHWGVGIITAFIRVEGRPIGVIANNPGHLSGAIDAPGADKGARFLQLCDAFDIPVLSLIDCPGIMVGPEIEKTALVRHAARMFVVGANVDVPIMSVVIRKSYGLGAQAMAGGSFRQPLFTVTWPTGEFGGMGLEGAVKLGHRRELAAIADPEERKATYDKMVASYYRRGKAVNMASHFELDDVIDPADTRKWITAGLRSLPPSSPRSGKKRTNVDTW